MEQQSVPGVEASPTEDSLKSTRSKDPSNPKFYRHALTAEGSINWHKGHKHNQLQDPGKKSGRSNGDLNMRGVFMHVMGGALGNIGVIASTPIIWITSFS